MSKNELQKIFDSTPAKSYKDKVKEIEDYFVSIADGENIIGTGKEIIYPEGLWEYKHSFAEGLYLREMKMKKDQLGFSAIHKHSYGFFLLSGLLASSKEEGVEEFIAPCYIISPQGAKRIVYAIEDCVIATIHTNPTNTEDLDELAKINVVFSWDEYNDFIKKEKEKK
tara:strand:- start:102 stop:605 length:504 start_codon:yes stop_codon:yes gene_type:complete